VSVYGMPERPIPRASGLRRRRVCLCEAVKGEVFQDLIVIGPYTSSLAILDGGPAGPADARKCGAVRGCAHHSV
jgi:hypothetical protein